MCENNDYYWPSGSIYCNVLTLYWMKDVSGPREMGQYEKYVPQGNILCMAPTCQWFCAEVLTRVE